VEQESDQISLEKGIGRFGFNAYQLEQAGYVKPGTSLKYFSQSNTEFVNIMSSPSVWTGRGGVYNLDSLLEDPLLQNQIQTRLMQQSYNSLLANGIINTPIKPSISISNGQVYTNTGLQSTQTLATLSRLGTNLSSLNSVARNALSNSPALRGLLNATNFNLNTIGSGAVNSLNAGFGNLGNLANVNFASVGAAVTSQLNGSVGALVANASKYGTQATALWAKAGNLQGVNLNNITSNLTNLLPPNLGGLTSNLNILGKASSFATNFANPLSGLNNLGGALTGQLGNLQGQLAGQLGNLQGQLAGQLGNLGNLANLGSLGSLFGGGGDLVSGTQVAAGFNNTVNRATVDAAFSRAIGSAKVPLPVFQYPSLSALAPRLDIQQAQNFLKNLQNTGQAAVSQISSRLG
jgi:hypothetical protein